MHVHVCACWPTVLESPVAHLDVLDGVGCQQLVVERHHLIGGPRPAQQVIQEGLENKAVTLVNQCYLRRSRGTLTSGRAGPS